MTLDRSRFVAFAASGAIWVTGTSLGLRIWPGLAAGVAAYVLLGSLLLAMTEVRAGVPLMALIALPILYLWGVPGLYVGSVFVTAWIGTGFMLLQFFSPHVSQRRVGTAGSGTRRPGPFAAREDDMSETSNEHRSDAERQHDDERQEIAEVQEQQDAEAEGEGLAAEAGGGEETGLAEG